MYFSYIDDVISENIVRLFLIYDFGKSAVVDLNIIMAVSFTVQYYIMLSIIVRCKCNILFQNMYGKLQCRKRDWVKEGISMVPIDCV